MTSANYPSTFSYNQSGQLVTTTGPKYTYSFDAMDRPTGLTDQSNNTDVSSVTYNAANQLLGLSYLGTTETRQYNNLNQMTNLTVGSAMNITYTFPAGANNGKISQQTNSVSGETVTYQYDSLNRLLSASSSQSWGETYGYDGFGNLLSKTPTGGAPTLSQSVNAVTNQIVGVTYDANGNQLSGGYGYDAENRLLTAAGIEYGYDSRNKRVWSGATSGSSVTQTVYFYGVDGKRLGIYSFTTPPSALGAPQLSDGAASLAVYFGGKRVGTVTNGATASFAQDRLGSNGGYYPYGEARGTVPQNDVGYATYTNDSATGLQYADQRYYASNFGRFMSADPYRGSMDLKQPQSLNHYTYVWGDPINSNDPTGLCIINGEEFPDPCFSTTATADGGSGGGGGASPGTNWSWVAMNFADTKGQPPLPTLEDANKQQNSQFQKAMALALKLLQKKDGKCAGLFGGLQNATDALTSSTYVFGITGALMAAGAGAPAQADEETSTVTISTLGPFFLQFQTLANGTILNYGASTGLTGLNFDAFILLHELGHLTGAYGKTDNDGAPTATGIANQIANNTIVLKDCFNKTFNPNP